MPARLPTYPKVSLSRTRVFICNLAMIKTFRLWIFYQKRAN